MVQIPCGRRWERTIRPGIYSDEPCHKRELCPNCSALRDLRAACESALTELKTAIRAALGDAEPAGGTGEG